MLPGFGVRLVGYGLHGGFLFPLAAAALPGQRVGGNVAGGLAKPPGQDGLGTERIGLARQHDEHRLRDFLRQMRIEHVSVLTF